MIENSRRQRELQWTYKVGVRCFISLFAIFLTGTAAVMLYQTMSLRIRGVRTTAHCMRTSSELHRNGRTTTRVHYLHLVFQGENGESHSAKIDASYTGVSAGKDVPVLYDPAQPSEVQVDHILQIYGYPIVILCTLLFFSYVMFRAMGSTWKQLNA